MRLTLTLCFSAWLWCIAAVSAPAPLGNPKAPKGGTFVLGLPGYPKALLHYLGYDELSLLVNALVLDTLIDIHPETYEPIPLIASSWQVSKDNKVFTLKLNPGARFSDGSPVTSADVVYTWEAIFNPKHHTAPFQAYFESFESCKAIDPHTVELKAKTLHFNNLQKLAGIFVMPKHFFSEGDFNKAFMSKLLGSGPYKLEEAKTGERITLTRVVDYWGANLPQNIGRYNFEKIVLKAVPDYNVQFEIFKKGDIDYFYFLTAKMWATETDGSLFKNNYILKLKGENGLPYATQGMVWNLRRPLFQDRRVRMALSHLMHREKMIKDLFYDNYIMATGVVPVHSEWRSVTNTPIPYDPKKAKAFLKEAGWTKVGDDGVLVKDKVRFEFEVLTDNPASGRYLTVYQEDLKQMGIKMSIRTLDWATKIKLVQDWQFDATDSARGRDINPSDFSVMWSSKEADIKGSGNHTGYKNPEVDELARKIDETFDRKKRIELVRKLDEIIAADQPMSFQWEPKYFRLGYWNKFSYPGKGYFKYSNWRDCFTYWWYDKAKAEKLKTAMAAGKPLP